MNKPRKIRVAVVDDYAPHREELGALLKLEGFEAHVVDSGDSLNRLMLDGAFDLVLLDLNLPGEDGLSIATRRNKTFPETRIIMLMGRARGLDKLQGYESGADIYLTKPQRPQEILAVIRSMARRIHPIEPFKTSPSWRLSLKESALESPRADVIRLSMREAGLINRLHLAPNQTLETTSLLKYFDLPTTKEGKTLLIGKMSRLRLKIQPHTSGTPCIKAHRQDGYQLLLDIQIV